MSNRNELLINQSRKAMDQFKMEVAAELNIPLGADAPARNNGKLGGQMVKRMIAMAESQISSPQ